MCPKQNRRCYDCNYAESKNEGGGLCGGDIDEQYCYTSVTINGTTLCLSSIYAPNDKSFLEDLKLKLLDFPDSVPILEGDINLDPTINTTSDNFLALRAPSNYIKTILDDLNIVDA